MFNKTWTFLVSFPDKTKGDNFQFISSEFSYGLFRFLCMVTLFLQVLKILSCVELTHLCSAALSSRRAWRGAGFKELPPHTHSLHLQHLHQRQANMWGSVSITSDTSKWLRVPEEENRMGGGRGCDRRRFKIQGKQICANVTCRNSQLCKRINFLI